MGLIHLQFEMVYTTHICHDEKRMVKSHSLVWSMILCWTGHEVVKNGCQDCTLNYNPGSSAESVWWPLERNVQRPIKPIIPHSVPASTPHAIMDATFHGSLCLWSESTNRRSGWCQIQPGSHLNRWSVNHRIILVGFWICLSWVSL
jgi:hypothetical protein